MKNNKMLKSGLILAVGLTMAACEAEQAPTINAEDIVSHIKVLASDDFGGRAPATEGETKTINYIADQFRSFGVKPALGNSYFQSVPMVEITADNVSPLTVSGHDQEFSLNYLKDMVVWTKRVEDSIALDQSEMVFVGYGIVAPEYGWNDYEGLDVEGKTVVILVNDPGFVTGDPEFFNGQAMTYYGRWTYKYAEAARQGAAGAIIIHQTAPAAYPWGVVESSWSGPQLDLQRPGNNMDRALVEGWISEEQARAIFAAADMDFDEAYASAKDRGFKASSLGMTASVSFDNKIRTSDSYNVAGIIEGTEHPDEAIIYMAHWDHLGKGIPNEEGDNIYNGAIDNASGTAAILELGEQFAYNPPKRSVVILAVTGEESGLLGSAYYAENPIVPLAKTVGGVNIDSLGMIGRTKNIVVVGSGKSELEEILAKHAAAQNRVVEPEETPERGYFYRSDHFSLAKVGVPMLYAEAGVDHVEHGREWGQSKADEYTKNDYHQPSDEYREDWDLAGAVEDVQLLYAVGNDLANSSEWPNWYENAEFRKIRDASRAGDN
ncbi:MAG: M28 family metallopeptidase [Sphingomonadales bacterium]|jgi:Zn-dependent M28 family amino/carboxypeptidase